VATHDIADLPQPPFVFSNLEYLNVVVEFDEGTVRSILAESRLEPAPTFTGGFMVYQVPEDSRLGPFSIAQAWVDVGGYDSTDGSRARYTVGGFYSGIYCEVARRIYTAPVLPGESRIDAAAGGEVVGRAFHRGGEAFRIRARLIEGEPAWRTAMHFYVRPKPDGRVILHHVGHSSEVGRAEPVDFELLLDDGSPLSRLRPVRLLRSIRQRMHLSVGVPIEARAADATAAEPDLVYLLSRINRGALLVDAERRVTFANAQAEALLGSVLGPSGSRPRAARHPLDAAIAALWSRVAGPLGPIAMARPGRPPLLLTGVPLSPDDAGGHPRRHPAATLVIVVDPDEQEKSMVPASLELLGLTPAEARVATLVGSGLAPREAAAVLGNSEGTIRVQLHRVYAKLNLSRQSELAAMVARVARLDL